MKLNNLLEAKYAGRETWIVQVFDPEEGLIEEFAGPFNTENEAQKFANELRATLEQLINQAGGEEEYGDYALHDLPGFNVSQLDSPDVLQNKYIESVREYYGIS